jgi:hypothetical protein
MAKRTVTVNDKMQKGYRYALTAPVGRNFDAEFKPELTPREMLRLGVFCGKYMTDCRKEFPKSWFVGAKLASGRRDAALNFFGIDASQPLPDVAAEGLDPPRGSARLVPMVLPLLHGAANARRGSAADQALEGDPPPRPADRAQLRAGRSSMPSAAAPGAAALGL